MNDIQSNKKEFTWEEFMKDVNNEENYEDITLDTKICLGLAQGDGWWGNMLAFEQHLSPRGDLASDYHDYCHMNALDPHEVNNAESFLKQIKMEQKLNKIAEDF